MDYMIISGPDFPKAVEKCLIEFAQTENIKFRRAGKSEMQGAFIISAMKEDDTVYVKKIETEEKLLWNSNRQRNLRHHPGRRWIDLRTMNK